MLFIFDTKYRYKYALNVAKFRNIMTRITDDVGVHNQKCGSVIKWVLLFIASLMK